MIQFLNKLNDRYVLEISEDRVQLRSSGEPKLKAIYVDFVSDTSEYRRKYGGGRSQAIARAVGLKKGATPSIVDATAGLGRDAFVLASLGCRVHMVERSPIVSALLEDGLNRAKKDPEIGSWVSKLMSFECGDSRKVLRSMSLSVDVVYLDPMYPEKKKPALVKKEMRIFKDLIGHDSDANDLLGIALNVSCRRVVVKRPTQAGWLGDVKPNTSIMTKKHRFDIYLTQISKS